MRTANAELAYYRAGIQFLRLGNWILFVFESNLDSGWKPAGLKLEHESYSVTLGFNSRDSDLAKGGLAASLLAVDSDE